MAAVIEVVGIESTSIVDVRRCCHDEVGVVVCEAVIKAVIVDQDLVTAFARFGH